MNFGTAKQLLCNSCRRPRQFPSSACVGHKVLGMRNAIIRAVLLLAVAATAPGQEKTVNVQSLKNVQFADEFPGTDASVKIQAAILALPASGGTVDARKLTESSSTTSGSTVIDPGNGSPSQTQNPVTILLGATTYNIHQIVLRANLTLIGMGSYSSTGTIIQATSTTDALIVLPSGAAQAVTGVRMQGIRFLGAPGNSASGMQIIASTGSGFGGGLWESYFADLTFIGFKGIGIDLEATVGTVSSRGLDQFNSFRDVKVYRVSSGGPALQLLGGIAQELFDNCQFQGPAQGDGTNVLIKAASPQSSFLVPNSIDFRLATSENANVAFNISGCLSCRFYDTHIESVNGGMQFNFIPGLYPNRVSVDGTYIATSGSNGGSGYLFNINSNQGQYAIYNTEQVGPMPPDNYILYSNSGTRNQVNQWNNYEDANSTLLGNVFTASTNPFAWSCGTTATCSNTELTNARVLAGTVPLSSGTATVTGISPAFKTGFNCSCSDNTSTANSCSAKQASLSSIAVAGTGTHTASYICLGN
jgi:hypothetical protein